MNTKGRIWLAVIAVLLLLLIWGQSLLSVENSSRESGWLREKVIDPLLRLVGLGSVSEHMVRKAAHVTEFLLLSFFTALFLGRYAPLAFPICFAAAFLDESIQIFSARGSSVRDIWIDLIGVAIGTALGWAVADRKNNSG